MSQYGTIPGYISIPFLGIFFIASVWLMYTQQKTLALIRSEHRRMSPGQVWLQLVPVFGLVWQFVVVIRLANSIRQELTASTANELFAESEVPIGRPTYGVGMQYAISFCLGLLPIPVFQTGLVAVSFGCLIPYWIELYRYKKKLTTRALLTGRAKI